MTVVGIIPARLASSRLPNKLLLRETGRPLIQYVWENACRCRSLDQVIVATDSVEIAEAVREFGGEAELTGEHPSGSDRIAEVVRNRGLESAVIVNIQGDEPELEPQTVDRLVSAICESDCEMATVAAPIRSAEVFLDPACVKVVVNELNDALYFSRSPIPFIRDEDPHAYFTANGEHGLLHLGLYAYRGTFLLKFTQASASPAETTEKLEQLRALHLGARIRVVETEHSNPGIDTLADYEAFVRRCRERDR